MRLILATQLLMVIFNIGFAWFQIPVLRAFRFWVPPVNPYTGPFHNRAMVLRIIVGSILLAYYYSQVPVQWDVISVLAALLWMCGSLVYNITLGWLFEGSPFALGHTSVTDQGLEAKSKHAGLVAAILLSFFIVSLNISLHWLI